MQDEKSYARHYLTNLRIFLAWLAGSGIFLTCIASLFLGFGTAAKAGGCAAGIVTSIILIRELTRIERDEQYTKSYCRKLEAGLVAEQSKLLGACGFIKEFASLENVAAHMKKLQAEYWNELLMAQQAVINQSLSKAKPLESLTYALERIGTAKEAVMRTEDKVRKAYELAGMWGFSLGPVEEFLKPPVAEMQNLPLTGPPRNSD
ncbi:MAG: hypothetical protein AAB910_02085 [Patescibacteria group bacterium]